ncbi:hypothetical protein OQ483_24015 (plasmid) [Enterobacter bugandensis]|uniref:hypothetical protein n=1 Tax=Enterobacter bugandensis TaxID=881260 RepID=UPI00283AA283|nr:hypothetical protein [Enterobacter bugandensis]WMU75449.1 hypothetical protein OQ483_24015 [Enterobacter bugandensis]
MLPLNLLKSRGIMLLLAGFTLFTAGLAWRAICLEHLNQQLATKNKELSAKYDVAQAARQQYVQLSLKAHQINQDTQHEKHKAALSSESKQRYLQETLGDSEPARHPVPAAVSQFLHQRAEAVRNQH